MKLVNKLALSGAILVAAMAPSIAVAAKGSAVTVRVEGKTKTLLLATTVRPGKGSVTRGGAPKGACSAKSGAGALDVATHHRWVGSWSKSLSDFAVTSILGERHAFSTASYWSIFVNNVSATTGMCGIKLKPGEQIAFAAVGVNDSADYLLGLKSVPATARVGTAFTVKVVYYDAKGKAHALAGASVTGKGITAATANVKGIATVTATKAGKLVLTARGPSTMYVNPVGAPVYIRGESTVQVSG